LTKNKNLAAYLEISSKSKEAKILPPPSLVVTKVISNAVDVNVSRSSWNLNRASLKMSTDVAP
jgi:hypothetical protein